MARVLIIEDERSIAELERDYLEVNGIESDIAMTGEDGIRLAAENDYDLILLDLMLPRADGFELCEKLRQTLDIPILMVTARKEDIDKIRGFDRGADDYIVKPFNPNELVARVKAHISRYERLTKKNESQQQLMIKNLRIDPNSRSVYLNEQEKTFTAKEFDLLFFLASHPNIVFTKEQLLERIWGYDFLGDASTVIEAYKSLNLVRYPVQAASKR